jgi:hypothetical protein
MRRLTMVVRPSHRIGEALRQADGKIDRTAMPPIISGMPGANRGESFGVTYIPGSPNAMSLEHPLAASLIGYGRRR